ncbi:MAG: peptidase G2 autoproteolytic cleavage domain-containing protein, partial [Peptostreptococcales bacterium]
SRSNSQVSASRDSTASGTMSQVNASQDSTASGTMSQVNASRTTEVNGGHGFTIGALNSEVTGNVSGIISAGRIAYSSTGGCKVTADNALVMVGRGVLNEEYGSIAGGLPTSPTATPSPPTTAERKYHLHCTTGDFEHAGQISSGHSFTDFAELFPNLTGQEQGYGLLQTIDSFGVRPAQEGERIIGVTSATAGIILGDTPFSWQGRWLKDEWGAYVYETITDEETGKEIQSPIENPEWNPEEKQQSRKERPDEWTIVGLVGQVYVRLEEDVEVMDYVEAGNEGIGQKSSEPTNIQVMKITQEYDAEKGYKIGFCLLK